MTDAPLFLIPQSLLVLVIMQFIAGFAAWFLKRPLLLNLSSGLLTGAVMGWAIYQLMPSIPGMFAAICLGIMSALFYCGLAERAMNSTPT